jgi:hypothetical protein
MSPPGDPARDAPAGADARAALTGAIAYWEPRRVLFNLVLAIVTGTVYMANFPHSRAQFTFDTLQALVVLAVLANMAYCAAYPVDVLAQLSGFRATWLKLRFLLFATGLLLGAILTNFFCGALFGWRI